MLSKNWSIMYSTINVWIYFKKRYWQILVPNGSQNWFLKKLQNRFTLDNGLMNPRKKGRFCLLYSLETLKFDLWLDSNPRPSASQSDPLSTIPNFPINFFPKFLRQILKDIYNLSVAESPVGSKNSWRFPSKRQKTRIVHKSWSR